MAAPSKEEVEAGDFEFCILDFPPLHSASMVDCFKFHHADLLQYGLVMQRWLHS